MSNTIPPATTKKTAIEDTQKEMRRALKHFSTKSKHTHTHTVMQKMGDNNNYKKYRKQYQNEMTNVSLLIRSYFKCKQVKLSNEGQGLAEWTGKNMINYMLFIIDSLQIQRHKQIESEMMERNIPCKQ